MTVSEYAQSAMARHDHFDIPYDLNERTWRRNSAAVVSEGSRTHIFIISSVIGGSSVALACRNPNLTGESSVAAESRSLRYGAMGSALLEPLSPRVLHHPLGRDQRRE